MPREAKPYVKNGWFVTSIGGVQHKKLCPVDHGKRKAQDALAALRLQLAHGNQPGPGVLAARADSVLLGQAHDDFLDHKKAEYGPKSTRAIASKLQRHYSMGTLTSSRGRRRMLRTSQQPTEVTDAFLFTQGTFYIAL